MELAGYSGALVSLAVFTIEDIKEKKLSVKKLMVFGSLACVYFLFREGFCWQELGRSILPGVGLLLLSWASKESIGFGDGVVVMILGLWTKMYFAMAVLCVGILAAGVYGMICLIKKKRESFPFLPFLLLGMEVVLLGV